MNSIFANLGRHAVKLTGLVLLLSSTLCLGQTLLQAPIVASGVQAPPLVLLTMSRDEKLIAPAYNDYSDIDLDGLTDIGYKTSATFLYFGNFSSDLCYDYNVSSGVFEPAARTTTKKCSGRWSGDFLNYVTTSRLDALRKSLYGGKRSTDDAYKTVLERAYVPQDSHVWGKEYDPATATYQITDYTPLAQPAAGRRHLFANVTRLQDSDQKPLMRVLTSRTERIWNWILKERPVAENNSLDNRNGDATAIDYVVRNVVCVSDAALRDADCKSYPGNSASLGATYKPVGILHDYGENKSIAFGLLSGSWANWKKGGVLRRNIEFFDSEVETTTGQFKTSVLGIVRSIDKFKVAQFTRSSYEYDCDASNSTRAGNCVDWASPVGEMMYEGLRYLAGGPDPTPAYSYGSGSIDANLGLGTETWKSPWRSSASGGFPYCSKPIQMVVSDIHPSFDSDDLPGASFGSGFTAPSAPSLLSSLNVTTQANSIWSLEGLPTANYFIGHSLAETTTARQYDQSPSLKRVNSFGNIRGLAPESPSREGAFYSAGVARFGKTTNINPVATQPVRNVDTYAIALSTPLPELKIPVGANSVSIIPVGQSVAGCNYGGFESGVTFPTNRITGFFITDIVNIPGFRQDAAVNGGRPQGNFRVGFEDNSEGTDNDMDAIVVYQFTVTAAGKVEIYLESEYAAGCIGQHLGFVVSGTTEDGKYLGVRDVDSSCADDRLYTTLGDDPANSFRNPNRGTDGDVCRNGTGVATGLGTAYRREFTPSGNNLGGNIPHDPLWYAVKYGGPKAPLLNGANPEGYFLVTNPALLRQQLAAAFNQIFSNANTGRTALRFSGTTVRGSTKVFIPKYDTGRWAGLVEAYRLDATTGQIGSRVWTTADDPKLNAATAAAVDWKGRSIMTRINGTYALGNFNVNGTNPPLLTDTTLRDALSPSSLKTLLAKNADDTAKDVVNYLRGDRSNEVIFSGKLRTRGAPPTAADPLAGGMLNSVLGDIVNSSLTYQGRQDFGYSAAGSAVPGASAYAAYVLSKASRSAVVYAGGNDGMMHVFDDSTGAELWAFIPKALQSQIAALARPSYTHRYFVDGTIQIADAYIGGAWKTILVGTAGAGARTVFAMDVTNPLSPSVIWELDGSDLPALGNVFGNTRVTSDSAGNWVVVLGNGYESTSTTPAQAALIIIPLVTSPTPRTIAIPNPTSSTVKNGLAPITIAQPAGYATNGWAGDLLGRLYRFSMTGAYTTWSVATTPMFEAIYSNVRQPITVAPAAIPSRNGGTIIYFGTGKFFDSTDADNKDVQTFYSLVDEGSGTLTRSNLTQYQISTQNAYRTLSQNGARQLSGYYVDLIYGGVSTGERAVAAPIVLFGTALFNTVTISTADVCVPGVSGWQMALDFSPGGNPVSDVFGATPPDASGNTTNYAGQASTGSFTSVSATSTLGGNVSLFYGSSSAGGSGGGAAVNCSLPVNRNKFVCQASKTGRTAWRQVF